VGERVKLKQTKKRPLSRDKRAQEEQIARGRAGNIGYWPPTAIPGRRERDKLWKVPMSDHWLYCILPAELSLAALRGACTA